MERGKENNWIPLDWINNIIYDMTEGTMQKGREESKVNAMQRNATSYVCPGKWF